MSKESRYAKQMQFEPLGREGQQRLLQSHVAIIGCGALGSAAAELLVRAGVGTIHLADRDYVEMSNLHRQQLFTEADAEQMNPKVVAAYDRLKAIRSDIELMTYAEHVDAMLMEQLAAQCDLIIDATDNFETRLLINDAVYRQGVPWIYGTCVGSTGSVYPFLPDDREAPCFRCLLPTLPSVNATCDNAGIIAPAVQITAAYQCSEALKWLTGERKAMRRKMLHFDVWNSGQMEIGIRRMKNGQCMTCGEDPAFPSLSRDHADKSAILCGRNAVQLMPGAGRKVTLEEAERLAQKLKLKHKRTPYYMELHYEGKRWICSSKDD